MNHEAVISIARYGILFPLVIFGFARQLWLTKKNPELAKVWGMKRIRMLSTFDKVFLPLVAVAFLILLIYEISIHR